MFTAAADSYDRFMGRYSGPLAAKFCDFTGVQPAMRVLDVGCGPGALVTELERRLGADAVSAVDPAEQFVAAARERHPQVDVRVAPAESLPFEDAAFDAALAQLVVHFMRDPLTGIGEMARVTRDGGVVSACVWDHAGGGGPLSLFWTAVHELDPDAEGESSLAGSGQGQLAELFERAGLEDVEESSIAVTVEHAGFEEWWEPYTLGVGPAGAYLRGVDAQKRAAVRERCRNALPPGPPVITAKAWVARGTSCAAPHR